MNDLMVTSYSADYRRWDWLKVGRVQSERKLPVTAKPMWQSSTRCCYTDLIYTKLTLLLRICLNYLDADGLCFLFFPHWRRIGAVSWERRNPWHFHILGEENIDSTNKDKKSTSHSHVEQSDKTKNYKDKAHQLLKPNTKYNMCMQDTQRHTNTRRAVNLPSSL